MEKNGMSKVTISWPHWGWRGWGIEGRSIYGHWGHIWSLLGGTGKLMGRKRRASSAVPGGSTCGPGSPSLHWWKLSLILFSCSFSFLLKPKYKRQWKTLWIGCSWWSVGSVHDVFLMWSSSTSWGNSDLAAHQCKIRWLTPKLGVCHPSSSTCICQLAHSQLCSLDDNLVEQLTTQGRGGLIHKPLSYRKGLPLVSFVFLQTLEEVI